MRGREGVVAEEPPFSLPSLLLDLKIAFLVPRSGNLLEREASVWAGRFGGERRKGDVEKNMVALMSRHGRKLQRYNSGRRLVVGCIPYKFKKIDKPCPGDIEEAIEVLVISSQKGPELMFPKGGWEIDESITEAASREAFEEAGVRGNFEEMLGKWSSKRGDKIHFMFPLRVTEMLQQWPEMNARERKWVTVAEARQVCKHSWMREALDKLADHLSSPSGL